MPTSFKLFICFFYYLMLSTSYSAQAHVSELGKAEFELLNNNQYTITLHADLLHILSQKFTENIASKNVDDEMLINKINTMSISDLLKVLKESKQDLKSNTLIYLDQQLVTIEGFQGPTLSEVRHLISTPAGGNGYPVTYIGKGNLSVTAKTVEIQLPEILGDTLLSIAKPQQMIVAQGRKSPTIAFANSVTSISELTQTVSTFLTYSYQGFIHIIPKGLDHILFVLALFLLTAKFSTLLWQVSIFTLAHTITLALGIFGIVNISASIVEPLIALSIAYIAIENIYSGQLKKWRVGVIFLFGLLHGLGFASVLLELGLAPSQYIISLVAFNVGVEIAQITVLLVALLCLYRFQGKAWYRQRIITPFSLLIALVGFYWFIERIL